MYATYIFYENFKFVALILTQDNEMISIDKREHIIISLRIILNSCIATKFLGDYF